MGLSSRTKAALITALAKRSHAEVTTAAVQAGIQGGVDGYTRHDRAANLVTRLFAEFDEEEASERSLPVAETTLQELPLMHDDVRSPLEEALGLDGYVFRDGCLMPVAPGPASLQREASLLETGLDARGFAEALAHYQQAADNLASGNHEAANGQTRSFLESLLIALTAEQTDQASRMRQPLCST